MKTLPVVSAERSLCSAFSHINPSFFCALLFLLAADRADSQIVAFTNESSFSSYASANCPNCVVEVEEFEGIAPGGAISQLNYSQTSISLSPNIIDFYGAWGLFPGCQATFSGGSLLSTPVYNSAPAILTFSEPIFAFGGHFYDDGFPVGVVSLTAKTVQNNSQTIVETCNQTGDTGFLGFSSVEGISQIIISIDYGAVELDHMKIVQLPSTAPVVDGVDVFNIHPPSMGVSLTKLAIGNIGVAADGSASTAFRIRGHNLDKASLRLQENPGNGPNEVVGNLDITHVSSDSITAIYHHPVYLDVPDVQSKTIHLEIVRNSTLQVIKTYPIKVVRPSVLMVHGLWSNGHDAFGDMKEFLRNTGMYREHQLTYVEYPSDRFFEENISTLINNKKALLIIDRIKNISSGKIDILAHSMGGILSRLYLQSDGYKNDINKLITFNTPHSGSQIADFLYNPANYYLHPALIEVGKDPTKGAIADLRVMSKAVRNTLNGPALNKNKAATHAITTTQEIPTTHPLLINFIKNKGWPGFILAAIATTLNDLNDFQSFLFNDDSHDLIVASNSQRGGLPIQATSLIDDQGHSSTGNAAVQMKTKALLNASPNDPLFTQNGYSPVTLNSNYLIGQDVAVNKVSLGMGDNLVITYPEPGRQYQAGDTVHLTVAGSSGITRILSTMGSENTSLQNDLAFSQNANAVFTVPQEAIGRLNIVTMGFNPDGYVNLDTTYIVVGTSAVLDSIAIQEELIYVPQNHSTGITVLGYFNDGVTRNLSGFADLSYSFHHGLAAHEAPKFIKGLDIGTDTVMVSLNGKTDFTTVIIVDPSEWITVPVDTGAVLPVTTADFSHQNIPCAIAKVQFVNSSIFASDYLWEFGDGTNSIEANPLHHYLNPGEYDVTLTATNSANGQSNLTVQHITAAVAIPSSSISPTGTVKICDGDTLLLSAAVGTGYTYQWYRNNTPIVNSNNQHYIAYQWGYFTVRVTDATGCSATSVVPTVVAVTPAPTVSASLQGPAAICPGDSTLISAASTGGIYFQWLLDGTVIPGAITKNLQATVAGSYVVVATNASGCPKTSFPVTVIYLPVPDITVTAEDQDICPGQAVMLSGSGAISYSWEPGNIGSPAITVQPSISTVYTVTGTGSNGCTSAENIAIAVLPVPDVDLGAADVTLNYNEVLALDAGAGFSFYEWSTGAITQTIVVSQAGMYSVTVTDNEGCTGSGTITVHVLVNALEPDEEGFQVKCYPNPTTGQVFFLFKDVTDAMRDINISVRNTLGQLVAVQQVLFSGQKNEVQFDLEAFPPGTYVIQIIAGKKIVSTVIIRQ
jgi:PKD repeat protein